MAKKNFSIIGYSLIAVALLGVGGYLVFGRSHDVALVSRPVSQGDLAETVHTTGKVKAADEVDLAFERGGKIVTASVNAGDVVKKGQLLAKIDSTDAVAGVRQAEASLDSAKIALEKLQRPPENIDLLMATDAVSQAIDAESKATDDLAKAYDAANSSIADTFLDMQTAVSGLKDVLHASDFSGNQENIDFYADAAKVYDSLADTYRINAENSYQSARLAYEKAMSDRQALGSASQTGDLDGLLVETYATVKSVASGVKAGSDLIDLYSGKLTEKQIAVPALATAQRARLAGYTAANNAHVSVLSANQTAIKAGKNALASSKRVLAERQEALTKLKSGAQDIDLRAQESRVEQAQASLDLAQSAVAKLSLFAPFDGRVSRSTISVGEMVASGAPAVSLASVSKYEIEAYVSEADIAKIAVGQNADVTLDTFGNGEFFPAIVTAVNPAQTTVNGIGTYGIKLQFAKDDERIKSGMTANVSVTTASHTGVLVLPLGSVITRGTDKFVLIDDGSGKSQERQVKIGIVSADNRAEIISGLKAGERVVSFGSN